nr:TraR/DksA family transcriptional regulator [Xanthomonas arboricola]
MSALSALSALVRSQMAGLHQGPSLTHCAACDAPIPEARRKAVPGVQLCVNCQEAHDLEHGAQGGFNRRGSKDSQLR